MSDKAKEGKSNEEMITKNVSSIDIEKEKLKYVNEINRAIDEKLQSSLRVIRFAVWSVSIAGVVLLGSLGFLGYKGYIDIQKLVEKLSTENADRIINSPEFRVKIDNNLGSVIEKRVNDMEYISKRISELKYVLSEHDNAKLIHTLFSSIEPRLSALEQMERSTDTQVEEGSIKFLNRGQLLSSIQFGKKELTKADFTTTSIGAKLIITSKILFKKPFIEPPQVFVQIHNLSSKSPFVEPFILESVQAYKDGFSVSSTQSATQNIKFQGSKTEISWFAVGK